jgi:hypothetical protein
MSTCTETNGGEIDLIYRRLAGVMLADDAETMIMGSVFQALYLLLVVASAGREIDLLPAIECARVS